MISIFQSRSFHNTVMRLSYVGKRPLKFDSEVSLKIIPYKPTDSFPRSINQVEIKGPKGVLYQPIEPYVNLSFPKPPKNSSKLICKVSVKDSSVLVQKQMWGTTQRLLQNKIEGVTEGFLLPLRLVGVGYRAQLEDGKLNLKLGFAQPVILDIPEGVSVQVPVPQKIILNSIDWPKKAKNSLSQLEVPSGLCAMYICASSIGYIGQINGEELRNFINLNNHNLNQKMQNLIIFSLMHWSLTAVFKNEIVIYEFDGNFNGFKSFNLFDFKIMTKISISVFENTEEQLKKVFIQRIPIRNLGLVPISLAKLNYLAKNNSMIGKEYQVINFNCQDFIVTLCKSIIESISDVNDNQKLSMDLIKFLKNEIYGEKGIANYTFSNLLLNANVINPYTNKTLTETIEDLFKLNKTDLVGKFLQKKTKKGKRYQHFNF
ncbi:hypothetical protein HDU92_006971 [Lobulomyces angularis]|nr:hypothetical protein HDU92_006971 [Lobulomyces angularis]